MAEWRSPEHLADHYATHSHQFVGYSMARYDASAEETIGLGTSFEYFHEDSGEWRTGYYHRETRRLTVLDEDGKIVTHFRCPEAYVRRLQLKRPPS
jgi:hypothetical protein